MGTPRVGIGEFHARVLQDVFPGGLADDDARAVFTLLHLYQFELAEPVLDDRPALLCLAPITQRHAAEALASIWPGGDPRADDGYWYHRWNSEWGGYGRVERIGPQDRARLRAMIEKLEQHPWVARVVSDDWDLLPPAAEP